VLADQSVLTVLDLTVEGDALERTETYVDAAGHPEVSTLLLQRVDPEHADSAAPRASEGS